MKLIQITALSPEKAEMRMYGTVSQWSDLNASAVSDELSKLSKKYKEIDIRLHSPGGSVFEGIAIRSAMQACPAKLTVIVDGVAASMGSILMVSGEKNKAAKNARIMIHQGSMVAIGSASKLKNAATLLESINNEMAEIYAEKTGKDKQWIIDNWMKEGEDKWFTAKEAQSAGLIDEIIESKSNQKIAAESFEEITAQFNDVLLHEDTETEIQNNSDMKEIAKHYGLSENATAQEIIAAIDAKNAESSANLVIAMGEKVGCITADNKAKFEKLAKADPALAIDFMPDAKAIEKPEGNKPEEKPEGSGKKEEGHVSLVAALQEALKGSKQSDVSAERKDWDFTKWSKEDPEGLRAMAKSDPEKTTKLLNATYGTNISQTELSKYIY